jgi:hypothetical protein
MQASLPTGLGRAMFLDECWNQEHVVGLTERVRCAMVAIEEVMMEETL